MSSNLQLPPALVPVLRPHQVDALHFMWRKLVDEGFLPMAARSKSSTIEQRSALYQEVFGCIIGHSMGLGKTLTIICFLMVFQAQMMLMSLKQRALHSGDARGGASAQCCPHIRVLVVCPRSCVLHWDETIREWATPTYFGRVSLPVHIPSTSSNQQQQERIISEFYAKGGIILMGYEEFVRRLKVAQGSVKAASASLSVECARVPSLLDRVRQPLPRAGKACLLDILESADVVVLDEAHRLRHEASTIVQTLLNHLRYTQLRIALTGTPLQNHLSQYNVMQSVVTARQLDTVQFQKYIIAPIERGQCVDSTFEQFTEMQKCVTSLRNFFSQTVHHCGAEVLEAMLPPRREFIFFFDLSKVQEVQYKRMIAYYGKMRGRPGYNSDILSLHHDASHICFHPCLSNFQGEDGSRQHVFNTLESQTHIAKRKKEKEEALVIESSSGDEDDLDDSGALPVTTINIDLSLSPKLQFAIALTEHIVRTLGEKVVIFSLYRSHLVALAQLLKQHLQIDADILWGSSTDEQRLRSIHKLKDDPNCRVMLCSVRAGGVGIKLVEANHCILLDVSWNPSDDAQATYRVFRFGQRRPVTIYRLSTFGTAEHVVFSYALKKSWVHRKIANVQDPTRLERHRKESYYTYPCKLRLTSAVKALAAATSGSKAAVEAPQSMAPTITPTLAEGDSAGARRLCNSECPLAAVVLKQNADLAPHLHAVVASAFLLREDPQDSVVTAMNNHFKQLQEERQARLPPPLPSPGLHRSARRSVSDSTTASLMDVCEGSLVDTAHQAANHLILHAIQRLEEVKQQSRRASGLDATVAESTLSGADTTAIVRETEARLCECMGVVQDLSPVVQAIQSGRPAPTYVAERVLLAYQHGVRTLYRQVLNDARFQRLRTTLTSRIPMSTRNRYRDAQGPSQLGMLEETLLVRPQDVFQSMSDVERTYTCTEMGLTRPFVPHCIVLGFSTALAESRGRVDNQVLLSLQEMLGPLDLQRSSALPTSDSEDDSTSDCHSLRIAERANTTLQVSPSIAAAQTVDDVLNELWPLYEGLTLPSLPVSLLKEEPLMRDAYAAANSTKWSSGLISLAEAAQVLDLQQQQHGARSYMCPRCRGISVLRAIPLETALGCSKCFYKAEGELRNAPVCHQRAVLFQLTRICGLLDSFSITRSFSDSFRPAEHTELVPALRAVQSHCAAPVRNLVEQCMREGVALMLGEYPQRQVSLLAIQVGVSPSDSQSFSMTNTLARMFLSNSSLVWTCGLRRHMRESLAQCFKDLVSPSTLDGHTSMPLMLLVLALQFAAKHCGVDCCGELLVTMSEESEDTARHRAILQLVCDGLAKLIYMERLLEYCREAPVVLSGPPSRSVSPPVRSAAETEDTNVTSQAASGKRKRLRDVASDSDSPSLSPVASISSPSSFASCYSGDRASFPSGAGSRSQSPSAFPQRAPPTISMQAPLPSGKEADAFPVDPIEAAREAMQQQRAREYWAAICTVYGTRAVQSLSMFVEDPDVGLAMLPAPPAQFWLSGLSSSTERGMNLGEVVDVFVTKVLDLSQSAPLIK